MENRIMVLAVYFAAVLLLGFFAKSKLKDSPGQYFLAGRGLGTFILLGTMAATNFSAFTVFGASGAGYRDGLAFFPIMGFGTGFMALSFWVVGKKIWEMGRKLDLVTPAELVGALYKNRAVSALFAFIMVFFTVPYLALQPLAGGKVLAQLFGIQPWAGACLVTLIILLYTLRGGFKAVAWTDVFQGVIMVALMIAALVMVADHFGGWEASLAKVQAEHAQLFSRPGGRGAYTPEVWLSFMVLWFFCDPMFPQLFQRFYTSKTKMSLGRTMLLYPAVCTVVFTLPITLGILGRLAFPGLSGRESDNIVPLLMTHVAGDFMGTMVLAAGLAALMSTMDSQLLTLSSIFSRDIYPLISGKKAETGLVGRVFVVVLALAGLWVALATDSTILTLGLTAFTGLAALFPTVFFGLYLKNPRPAPALASLIVGEALVAAYHLKLLPAFGFLPAIPVIAGSVAAYLVAHISTGPLGFIRQEPKALAFAGCFGLIFLLAQDYWRWGEVGSLWLGWPSWAWYFVGLSTLQIVFTALMLRAQVERK